MSIEGGVVRPVLPGSSGVIAHLVPRDNLVGKPFKANKTLGMLHEVREQDHFVGRKTKPF